ncbi:MAG: hypothetical protein IJU48_09035 [Synergistaceae bacterium]|nr:hypothetical protein [Synergistaceae bacterium]
MMNSFKKAVAAAAVVMTITSAGSAFAMPYGRGPRMSPEGMGRTRWEQGGYRTPERIRRPDNFRDPRIGGGRRMQRDSFPRGPRGGRWERTRRW